MSGLLEVEQHFAFGKNWQSFAKLLNDDRIEQAENGLKKLFPNGELEGASFLDIGCGSGLSSLAAYRLGAKSISAIDIDRTSVATTREVLSARVKDVPWIAEEKSVFDLDSTDRPQFDVVYSWGVLHHTGDMWRALRSAARMVRPGGHFAIALYAKTRLCGFWTAEKKFYSNAPRPVQLILSGTYTLAFCALEFRHRKNPIRYIRNYHQSRGMSFFHDVHDWLGGYPYESASPQEVRRFLHDSEFDLTREFVQRDAKGYLGSGCNEFVAIRKTA